MLCWGCQLVLEMSTAISSWVISCSTVLISLWLWHSLWHCFGDLVFKWVYLLRCLCWLWWYGVFVASFSLFPSLWLFLPTYLLSFVFLNILYSLNFFCRHHIVVHFLGESPLACDFSSFISLCYAFLPPMLISCSCFRWAAEPRSAVCFFLWPWQDGQWPSLLGCVWLWLEDMGLPGFLRSEVVWMALAKDSLNKRDVLPESWLR
jgi:hypothetical protein